MDNGTGINCVRYGDKFTFQYVDVTVNKEKLASNFRIHFYGSGKPQRKEQNNTNELIAEETGAKAIEETSNLNA